MGAFVFGASPVLDLCETNEIVHLSDCPVSSRNFFVALQTVTHLTDFSPEIKKKEKHANLVLVCNPIGICQAIIPSPLRNEKFMIIHFSFYQSPRCGDSQIVHLYSRLPKVTHLINFFVFGNLTSDFRWLVASINQADSAERISQMSNVNIFGDKTWMNVAGPRSNHSSLNVKFHITSL